MIAQGDRVQAKKDDGYEDEFAGRIAVVTRTERQWGGVVAYVRFDDGETDSFYADGLRRVREKPTK